MVNLNKYLPSNSEEVIDIQNSLSIENEELKEAIKDVLDQLFVETATWGLQLWEQYLRIGIDLSQPILDRRERILSRLRSNGTITVELLKDICKSFTGGEVEIIENHSDFSFVIKFISLKGIPNNLDYLSQTIEAVKPVHVAYKYEYTYLTWNEFDKYNKTWNQWDTLNLTWDEFEVFIQ